MPKHVALETPATFTELPGFHRQLLNALAVQSWWMDDAGVIGFLSNEWRRIHQGTNVPAPKTGYPELTPHALWMQAMDPDDAAVWHKTIRMAITAQSSFWLTARFRNANGQWRVYQLSAQRIALPVTDNNHSDAHRDEQMEANATGWAGSSLDITPAQSICPVSNCSTISHPPRLQDRARSKQVSILPQWINVPQDILNNTTEAFVAINAQAVVTGWNPAATATLGWEAADIIGRTLYDTVVPDRFIAQVRDTLERYSSEDSHPLSQQRIDAIALTRLRGEILIDLTISRIQTEEGIQFNCFLHDITARKKAERELKHTRDLLHNVMDSLPAIVAYVDDQCIYRYCNKAYLDLFSIKPEQVLGKSVQGFFSEAGYAMMKPHIDQVFQGKTVHFERPVEVRGERRYFEGRYIPELNASDIISGFYVMVWDVTERHIREIELRSMATLDNLTGVFNRATLQEHVQSSIDTHFKQHESLALMYLDIDHFKNINDNYGHAAGDEVLINFSKRLRMAVRTTDMIWRIGGDEFVICLNGMSSAEIATSIASKIIELVRTPVATPGHTIHMTTSIGLAYLDGEKCRNLWGTTHGVSGAAISFDQLLETADAALYEAKRLGRDRLFCKKVEPDAVFNTPSIGHAAHKAATATLRHNTSADNNAADTY